MHQRGGRFRGRGGGRGDRGRGERGRGERGRGDRGRGDRGRGRGRGEPFGWMTAAAGQAKVRNTLSNLQLNASSITKFEDLKEGRFAPKPDDGGVAGRSFRIRTNFFQFQCTAPTIFQYDVEIRDHGRVIQGEGDEGTEVVAVLPPKLNRAIIQQCASQHSFSDLWAFDGRRLLFAPKKLMTKDKGTYIVHMDMGGKEKLFDVKIALATTLKSTDVQRYLQQGNIAIPYALMTAIEVCLKASFVNDPAYLCYGRSVFMTQQSHRMNLPEGAELWQGHFQSIRMTQNGLALNMDITYNAFIKEQSVIDWLLSMTQFRNPGEMKKLDARGWRQLGRELSGLFITTTHTQSSKKHRCTGFTKQPADAMMFKQKDGRNESVAGYWKGKYGNLRFPWMPCVDASKGKKLNYIPVEVCWIAPGQRRAKPSPEQTATIITAAARKPADRFRAIKDAMAASQFNQNQLLTAFNINAQNREIEAAARQLPQPHLQYSQPECLDTGDRGAWNLQDVKLYRGGTLHSWSVVSFARNTSQLLEGNNGLHNFIRELQGMMQRMGLQIPNTAPPIVDGGNLDTKSALLQGERQAAAVFKKPAELVMVMLPNKDSFTYKEIKRVAEGELGSMTQCFVMTNAGIGRPARGQLQYLANITMKINLKIGGKNCKLLGSLNEMFPVLGRGNRRPFIIFGADVTHPRTRDTSEQSVGAVVASMDSELSEFCSRPVALPHRQETLDMAQAIKELLICFLEKNKVSPEAVFFYRDGVSDGQFESVLHHEYHQFQTAFKALDPKYKPPITFIVVKKRHHLRMFPSADFGDRNGNAKPGTVVDTDITSKYDFDFYLNSHAGIQGTNKPAHYYCLLDENGFGSDGLQLFTYWFCYLYGRCTRSVSYAPPAYYAHHAAEHAKYLTGFDSDVSSMEGGQLNEPIAVHGKLKNRMFYA